MALAADIQTIPGLPTAPGYLNVDVDAETGRSMGCFERTEGWYWNHWTDFFNTASVGSASRTAWLT